MIQGKYHTVIDEYAYPRQALEDLYYSELEKCVVLFQMGTYVGLDIYSDLEAMYPNQCNVDKSIKFLEDNASFIDY